METRPTSTPIRRTPKQRLLFDRRYGWVYDEWKDPSEEALAGGRGMFCILPITKSLLKSASQLMNGVATSAVNAVKVLEDPSRFSPLVLQANLISQFQKLMHCAQKPNIFLLASRRDSRGQAE